MTTFIDLAPRGPLAARRPNEQWDVFLSYRSVNRSWVLRLYDILNELGYAVFMDQFVLSAGESLAGQLGEALDRSTAGVLIWSSRSEDSAWCTKEFNTMTAREEEAGSNFKQVVVRIDNVELPRLAREKLWIDFQDCRDGPTGSNLLRLLYGLHGRALSPEAVRLATEHDEAVRRASARVEAARANGDHEALVALAAETGLEWRSTPTLSCKVAEGLIALGRQDDALKVLEPVLQAFPRSIRPQQLKGLALARKGDWRAAQNLLGELYALGERDPETMGMLARTWRDRHFKAGLDPLHLRKARNLYAEAFALVPSDYYPGINAATNSVLLGDLPAAETYAAAVEKLVGTEVKPRDYWATATVAEVQLIRRQFTRAAQLYAAAIDIAPEDKSSHQSTAGQARRLLAHLNPSAEERATIEAVLPPPV